LREGETAKEVGAILIAVSMVCTLGTWEKGEAAVALDLLSLRLK
jgi:hypothetical protein